MGNSSAGSLLLMPIVLIVVVLVVFMLPVNSQLGTNLSHVVVEQVPVEKTLPRQGFIVQNFEVVAEKIAVALTEVHGFKPNLSVKGSVLNTAVDPTPTLPRIDSAHTAKHPDYALVVKAIRAWLLDRSACGLGVTAHLKTDEGYSPPAVMVMTVCWRIGGSKQNSGFVLVDIESGVGVTGFIAPTTQLCWILRRDNYSPATAAACSVK